MSQRIIFNHLKSPGPGVYTTAEGDIYTGMWENDRLGANEEVTITFTDTARFEGLFKDWCFSGPGKYTYPDNSILQCDFVENSPVGNLVLTDPNGHTWLGRAEQGFGWFEPVNHFYTMLEKTRESDKIRRRHKNKDKSASEVVTVKSSPVARKK